MIFRIPVSITAICLTTLCVIPTNAQFGLSSGQKTEVLQLDTFISQDKLRPGDTFNLGVKITMMDGWHINSNQPDEDFLIATSLFIAENQDFDFGTIHYPVGQRIKFEFSETPLSVYEKDALIRIEISVPDDAKTGQHKLMGTIQYQACNNTSCLAPREAPFEIAFDVVPAGSDITKIHLEQFESSETELDTLQGQRQSSENEIDRLLQGSGLFITLGFIFVGGLALNLTPCVYPIIPITIGFFVGQASGSIFKSFLLALIYVMGMSVTYSVLGVIAAMTGGLLGASLQNPLVLIGIASIFLIFAASMFGAFDIRIPDFLNRMAGGSRQGIFGSLFMGLTVGIVAAPCIGPLIISLLTYVAAKGDPYTGFLLFFVLSLGLGLPYLILGTFSGLLQNLPRSGEWMIWVKKVFGFIMIALAIYFVSTLIPDSLYVTLLTGVFVVGGIVVGLLDKSKARFWGFRSLKALVGMALLAAGIWNAASAWHAAHLPHIKWQTYDATLLADAQSQGTPVLIDFYADWCIPCKQIDKSLFSDSEVVAASERFMTLKADLTQEKSEQTVALRRQYNVFGVPTIILIDRQGTEYRRFTDELVDMNPDDFLKIMAAAFGNE